MMQYQADIEKVMESSRYMQRMIDDFNQQLTGSTCTGCRQRDQKIKQLEDTIRELRAHTISLNAEQQQLMSTHISERQQEAIDLKITELIADKKRAEDKYSAMVQELEAYKAQLEIYQDDFNTERQDRAQARGELAKVANERDQYLQQLKEYVARDRQQNCGRQFYLAEPAAAYALGPLGARGPRHVTVGVDETDTPDAVPDDYSVSSVRRGKTSPAANPPHVRSTNSSPVGGGDFTEDFRLRARDRNALDSGKYDKNFCAGVTNGRSGAPSYAGSISSSQNAAKVCEIDLMSFPSIDSSLPAPTRSSSR